MIVSALTLSSLTLTSFNSVFKSLFLIFSFLLLFACESKLKGNNISKEVSKTLLEQVTERKIPKKDLKIYIQKAKRTLSVQYKTETLISYPCVLGFAPGAWFRAT